MTHWDRVKDKNAVSFLTIGLVYAYLNFQEKREKETKAGLERSFPKALLGIRGHKVRWQYTNIFFHFNVRRPRIERGTFSLARAP